MTSLEKLSDLPTKSAVSLTSEQLRAKNSAVNAMMRDDGMFVLSGLAGTGKTTTLVEIVSSLLAAGRRPAVCAPTGKAVSVINSKQQVFRAKTLHSVLTTQPFSSIEGLLKRVDEIEGIRNSGGTLDPHVVEEEKELFKRLDEHRRRRSDGKLSFDPVEVDEFFGEHDCLIVDESSMVGLNETYIPFIERIPCAKLFIGDKAQLPPVNDIMAIPLERPDAELTTILRQQADSGILKYAHMLTKGEVMSAKAALAFPDITIVKDHLPQALDSFLVDHQVVCWTNPERGKISDRARNVRGVVRHPTHPFIPMVGETLMVDKNSETDKLMRGDILTVTRVIAYMEAVTLFNPYIVRLEVSDPLGRIRELTISLADMFDKTKPNPKLDAKEDRRYFFQSMAVGIRVQFSYAVTCHKAQGSEWDKVVYVGSMMPGSKEEWRKHWYTGCTRARNNLVVASYHYAHE